MIFTKRACLFALCVMLSLSPLGGALADPAIKAAIKGLVSTGLTVKEYKAIDITDKAALAKLNNQTIPDLFKTNAGEDLTGILGGLVIGVAWSSLEPAAPVNGTVTLITDLIDKSVDAVKAINTSLPDGRKIGVRLRIFAGCSAGDSDSPEWAMKLDQGFPVAITAEYDGGLETCSFGKFWEHGSNYSDAWRQFQTALAAKYDSEPVIREVSISSCSSFSAEPFFLNTPTTPHNTWRTVAGFNDDVYRECLTKAIDDYEPWKAARLEFAFNAFGGVDKQADIGVSERIMRRCRLTVGTRCILSNRDLASVPPSPSTVLPIYALERKFGPLITFQTFRVLPADYEGTLRKGLSLGAGAIEVWPGGYQGVALATLQNWALMFEPQ